MSRLFTGSSSQGLYIDQAIVTAPPLSMACWFYAANVTDDHELMWVGDKDVTNQQIARLEAAGEEAGDPIQVRTRDVNSSIAATSSGFSADTWHHAAGVWASASSRAVYIDGGSKGTNSDTVNPDTPDRFAIGYSADSTPGDYATGRICEEAIWDVALTDAEVALLAKGFSPLFVHPQNLVAYWPLIRDEDQGIIGGYDLTALNAPTIAGHYPIRRPAMRLGALVHGMVQKDQSAAGTLTTAGVVAKSARATVAGALTTVGAVAKKTIKAALAGTSSTAGVAAARAGKALAGTLTMAGVVTGKAGKALAGALATAGGIVRKAAVSIAGTSTTAGAVAKKTVKAALAGTSSTAGVAAARAGKALAGTLTTAGVVTEKAGKALAGALTTAGGIVRETAVDTAGALMTAGAVAKAVTKSALAGTLSTAGVIIKKAVKSALAGTLTTAGAVSTIKIILKSLAGTLTTAGAVARQAAISTAGTLTTAGVVGSRAGKALAGTLTTAGAVIKKTVKSALAGTLAMAGAIAASAEKAIYTSVGPVIRAAVEGLRVRAAEDQVSEVRGAEELGPEVRGGSEL